MHFTLSLRPTDWLLHIIFLICLIAIFYIRQKPHLRTPWQQVFRSPTGMTTFTILTIFIIVAQLDSIHFNVTHANSTHRAQPSQNLTLFDVLVNNTTSRSEKTYSPPLATHSLQKSWVVLPNGQEAYIYPRLKHAGKHLLSTTDKLSDLINKIVFGLLYGLGLSLLLCLIFLLVYKIKNQLNWRTAVNDLSKGKTILAWRSALITLSLIFIITSIITQLHFNYYLFGTGKIGQDIFIETIKSVRTAILIGTLTTLFMLPFALFFGTVAGYFGGWIDDIIQYLYTTISAIPGVLLISAMVLVMQMYITNHPSLFPTLADRADARLLTLCLVLGLTSWAGLCRLLRAETLKLREQDFVSAAVSMGSKKIPIILKHILPNVMHIIVITIVLDFSGLVLAEAILSYVGVGVDPTTSSWGNIINSSRLELAREPMVWWPLLAALLFMFILVLTANLFADVVRDAFDPRLRKL